MCATGESEPGGGVNAICPLIGGIIAGLVATGDGDSLQAILGSADSFKAMLWASLIAVITAFVLALGRYGLIQSFATVMVASCSGVMSAAAARCLR